MPQVAVNNQKNRSKRDGSPSNIETSPINTSSQENGPQQTKQFSPSPINTDRKMLLNQNPSQQSEFGVKNGKT